MLLFVLGSVCIVTGWSIHSLPHTRWYIQSQTFHTFLSCLYVYLSKAEYVSQSKFARLQHTNHAQLLESSLAMEGMKITDTVWNGVYHEQQHMYIVMTND